MKKQYIAPETHVLNIVSEGMLAASTKFGTGASSSDVDNSNRSAHKQWGKSSIWNEE